MTHVRIATGAEMPINKHDGRAAVEASEATLVGVDDSGQIVAADADSSATVKARGVLLSPVSDTSGLDPEIKIVAEAGANRTVKGRDMVTFVEFGIELENSDEDWDFTPGADVYLAVGGGFTETAPSDPDLVQKVGYALFDGNRIALHVDQSA